MDKVVPQGSFEETFGENKGKDVEFLLNGENLVSKQIVKLQASLQSIEDVQKTLDKLLGESPDTDNLLELTLLLDIINDRRDWHKDNLYEKLGSKLYHLMETYHDELETYDYNVLSELSVIIEKISDKKSLFFPIYDTYNLKNKKKRSIKDDVKNKLKAEIAQLQQKSKKIKKEQLDVKRMKGEKWLSAKDQADISNSSSLPIPDYTSTTKIEDGDKAKVKQEVSTTKQMKQEYRPPVDDDDDPWN
jgi:hypothetical protein